MIRNFRLFSLLSGLFCLGLSMTIVMQPVICAAQATPGAYLDVPHRFYGGDSIIELPAILGAENSVIHMINREVEAVGEAFALFEAPTYDDIYWCEVVAYTITSEPYLNILLTAIEYPTYGTSGDLYGWVYDKQAGNLVSLGQALDLAGVPLSKIEADLRPGDPGWQITKIINIAFTLDASNQVIFYIQARADNPEVGSWNGIYRWQNGKTEQLFGRLIQVEIEGVRSLRTPLK